MFGGSSVCFSWLDRYEPMLRITPKDHWTRQKLAILRTQPLLYRFVHPSIGRVLPMLRDLDITCITHTLLGYVFFQFHDGLSYLPVPGHLTWLAGVAKTRSLLRVFACHLLTVLTHPGPPPEVRGFWTPWRFGCVGKPKNGRWSTHKPINQVVLAI